MNRAERRKRTLKKYISRVKKCFKMDGHSIEFSSWKEFADKVKWTKLFKHNKLYGRSTMNNVEKHKTHKFIREESKKICKEDFDFPEINDTLIC